MTYALWDLDTGNWLGDFRSESAAYAAVSRIAKVQESPHLALEARDAAGQSTVLSGPSLVERARQVLTRQHSHPARVRVSAQAANLRAAAGWKLTKVQKSGKAAKSLSRGLPHSKGRTKLER